jgi:hypothetical protein
MALQNYLPEVRKGIPNELSLNTLKRDVTIDCIPVAKLVFQIHGRRNELRCSHLSNAYGNRGGLISHDV